MILVIGGAYQGKTHFVTEHFPINEQELINGENCNLDELVGAKAINHFERLVYQFMIEKKLILPFMEDLLQKNNDIVIITTEIGCGLVPIDKFDREYRETVGRACCELVKRANQVYRVQSGIATKIYDRLAVK